MIKRLIFILLIIPVFMIDNILMWVYYLPYWIIKGKHVNKMLIDILQDFIDKKKYDKNKKQISKH